MVFIATASFWAVGPASNANNFAGTTGLTACVGLNTTENAGVAISYSTVSAPIKAAMEAGRVAAADPTDVNTSVTTSTVYDDVRVFDEYYTQLCGAETAYGLYLRTGQWGGVIGVTKCMSVHPTGTTYARKCDRHYIHFDQSTADPGRFTATQLEANAVHELGHTLGLMHTSAQTSVMFEQILNVKTYDAHDKGHLNANF